MTICLFKNLGSSLKDRVQLRVPWRRQWACRKCRDGKFLDQVNDR